MHYRVARRTRRSASHGTGCGAAHGAGHGRRLVLTVAGIGVGGALVAARTIASLLFGVTPHDLVTFAAVSFGMMAIAMIACCIPSPRAARIEPMLALKIE
jgi:putative ABC transport system permease protein